jgi:hypothetical protein
MRMTSAGDHTHKYTYTYTLTRRLALYVFFAAMMLSGFWTITETTESGFLCLTYRYQDETASFSYNGTAPSHTHTHRAASHTHTQPLAIACARTHTPLSFLTLTCPSRWRQFRRSAARRLCARMHLSVVSSICLSLQLILCVYVYVCLFLSFFVSACVLLCVSWAGQRFPCACTWATSRPLSARLSCSDAPSTASSDAQRQP